jgi:hypothetical protein
VNWNQFKKNIGARYKVEPPACSLDELGAELGEISDDWILTSIGPNDVAELTNARTQHVLRLAKDHIYDFRSDTTRPNDGSRYGFLVLKIQVFLQGARLSMRPNTKPGERVRDSKPFAPVWTPYVKVKSKGIPVGIGIRHITVQYKLAASDPKTPLLIRFAATAVGGYPKELSGPSGTADLLLVEPETYYVSVSHPSISYEVGVLGWRDSRRKD